MKQLTQTEIETMEKLMKRAIANNQLNIAVASPYAEGENWKADGWTFNDRHDGNAVNSGNWNVEAVDANGEDPETGKEYNRHELTIYVGERELLSLAGVEA